MLLSEDHVAYQAGVRRLMEEVVRPAIAEFDLTKALSREDISALRSIFSQHELACEQPMLEDGRPDLIATGIFNEELSRIDCSIAHSISALFFNSNPTAQLFNDEQKVSFAHLLEPGSLVAVGMSEPNVGSNPSGMETTARRDGEDWVINGQKLWTSNATISDAILVAARIPEEDGATGAFIVDRRTYSYEPRDVACLGWTGMSTCEVNFVDCKVPALARIGEPGKGLAKLFAIPHIGRLNISFGAVGVAQASLELAVDYAKNRVQFGRPIGSFQMIQQLIAEMATEVHAGRLLALHAAALVQAGAPAMAEVSMAKAFCTEMAVRVTSKGIQVHGAIGLTKECSAERFFRDARMHTIPDGTTQIQQLIIGRQLLGISAIA